jgi:glycosidase
VDVSGVAAADPGSALPAGWHQGAFMEVFVRSYKDSDGDGVGDLRGLIQQLDYLRDLGIKGLWLMPVTRSQDHDHGYAVTDYRNIETQFGTLADFDDLLRQAHARGMGVIIDYVMNHSASQHPLFLNSSAASTNPYRDWYVWQPTAPSGWTVQGGNPWRSSATGAYYAAFSGYMPDFNLTNAAALAYHHDNLRFWLNRGVDGFRFDAVGNLVENGPAAWENQPQNYVIMSNIRALLNTYSQRFMVCEAPNDPIGFGAANIGGSAFAFKHQTDLINAARGQAVALQAVADYFKTAPTSLSTMLSNHDSFAGDRVWDQLGGNVAQYKLAAALYLLQPGTPFLYYGEEVGMSAGAGLTGDAKLRSPMSWSATSAGFSSNAPYRAMAGNNATQNVAAQTGDPASLLNFYKAMLNLRNTRASIARGDYVGSFVSGSVLGFQRRLGGGSGSGNAGETTLVMINTGTSGVATAVGGLPANATLTELYPGSSATQTIDSTGGAVINLAAQSVRVFNIAP